MLQGAGKQAVPIGATADDREERRPRYFSIDTVEEGDRFAKYGERQATWQMTNGPPY